MTTVINNVAADGMPRHELVAQLAEARVEAARWERRLKLLDSRARLAEDLLSGHRDDLLEQVEADQAAARTAASRGPRVDDGGRLVARAPLAELQRRAHATSKAKGWHDARPVRGESGTYDLERIASMLALVHSEVSEALECVRDGEIEMRLVADKHGQLKPEGMASELADVVIRVLDLAGACGLDLERAVLAKMSYNDTRQHRHGGRAL